MSLLVVDASVVLKWFVPEIHSEAARRLLQGDHHYFAPDLLFAEIANAVWKKVVRGELSWSDGKKLASDIESVAVETVPCRVLATDACALAIATRRSAYDAMYLALAVRLKTQMVTADEKLARALAGSPIAAPYIQTVQQASVAR